MVGLRSVGLIVGFIFIFWCSTGVAQQYVHFPYLDDNGVGQPPTMLDGYRSGQPARLDTRQSSFCTAAAVCSAMRREALRCASAIGRQS